MSLRNLIAKFCWFAVVFLSSFTSAEIVGVLAGGDHTIATWALLTAAAGVLSSIVIDSAGLAAPPRALGRSIRMITVAAAPSSLAVLIWFFTQSVGSIQLALAISVGGALNAALLLHVREAIVGDSGGSSKR